MVRHLAHVQANITFELEAYQICGLVPSEVWNLMGIVEELGEQVECLNKDLDLHNKMIVDSERVKDTVMKEAREVSQSLSQAEQIFHMVLLKTTHSNWLDMHTHRDLIGGRERDSGGDTSGLHSDD